MSELDRFGGAFGFGRGHPPAEMTAAPAAGFDLPDDLMAAIGSAAAGIPLQTDQISNLEAARLAAFRREPITQRALPGARGQQALGDPVAEAAPAGLPAILRRSVFDPQSKAVAPPDAGWRTIYDMPGYLQENIRALGRSVFQQFSCFAMHHQAATAAGHDPLGSIRLMLNVAGNGPNTEEDLGGMAAWIRDNGMVVLAEQMNFAGIIDGYTPRVILCATADESFLMVEETRESGAPCDALYIYSWMGGRKFYLDNPAQTLELAGNVRRAPPRRNKLEKPALVPMAMTYATNLAPKAPAEVRRQRVMALPVGTDELPETLSLALRRSGFIPFGPQLTPRLRKAVDGGGYAEIVGQDGVVASRSDYFDLQIFDEDGDMILESVVRGMDDVELALDGQQMSQRY